MNEFQYNFNKFWLDSYNKYNKEGLSFETFILSKTKKYMHSKSLVKPDDPVLKILKELDLDPDPSKLFTNPDFDLNNRYLN